MHPSHPARLSQPYISEILAQSGISTVYVAPFAKPQRKLHLTLADLFCSQNVMKQSHPVNVAVALAGKSFLLRRGEVFVERTDGASRYVKQSLIYLST